MAYILSIETATAICSISLSCEGKVVAYREQSNGNSHSACVLPFIDEILHEAHLSQQDLSAVAVSKGPGSYTGLRIGVSTAKGLCAALGIPLIAVSTLKSIANGVHEQDHRGNILICPMIDARRMEVYCALYDQQLEIVQPVDNKIIDKNSFADVLSEQVVVFCGDANEKVSSVLSYQPKAEFVDVKASANYMASPAYQQFLKQDFVDVAYFEPFYLKSFQSAVSKVKGLK